MKTIIINLDSPGIASRLGLSAAFNKSKARKLIEEGVEMAKDSIMDKIPSVGIKTRSGNLINSIKSTIESDTQGKLYVDETLAPYASYLNYGYSGFSMRPGLLTGGKSKISKEGFRYNRIPMEDGEILTISEKPRTTKSGAVSKRQAKWYHPPYSGRLFWEQGIEEARYSIIKMVNESFAELFLGDIT
jgi:hypothetical protein